MDSFSFKDRTFPVYHREHRIAEGYDLREGAIFLMNKPKGWTSFDVVGYVRNRIGVKKTGHAGTLDPMATGLLVICVGKATKAVELIQNGKKEYIAEVKFGASTPTYDSESDTDAEAPTDMLNEELVEHQLQAHFSGEIEQIAPAFSALKHQGNPLYKLARAGKETPIKKRKVHIFEHELLKWELPQAHVRILCSKGTYIRSIAHDLGKACNSLAHLTALHRTLVTPFDDSKALQPQEFKAWLTDGEAYTF